MSLTNLCTQDDRVMCKLFTTTLTEVSQEWYLSLPADLVDSFEQLKTTFVARFIGAVKARHINTDRTFLKQHPTEPIRDYLNCFQYNDLASQRIECRSGDQLHGLKHHLRQS
ncbi:hypothetical protein M5689_001086 [Euphorbia peplus]|nr:hypothetical protein M5689_001086 [Euphorbia peplus]